ncbi:glycerophosphodiester phosphodiesterase [Exiguobacterium aurantiacum]|uniref:Glycerophosphodiester phosphodiesterase n=1 Tax=Exiguobacterium aurantiacum TaxID=33987 RepID=A0ABY5FT10_9BACL|nr:glycerophosphodiester phosphodiesterase [Exiguobacterium aurantiacum]UTT44357.1 glycerophosphodiester phosphodiesterase [Exiguobacterium aurantiacum]
MKLYAHRGVMARYPENTMSAFRAAVDAKADGIEADVHMTKDGELVLIHDETINRTTDGQGRIADMTLAELRAVNVGVMCGANDRIPTLEELIDLCRGTALRLNLEVKTDIERYPGIEERLIDSLRDQHVPAEQVVFSSFNHATLNRLHQLAPEFECAVLLAQPLYEIVAYCKEVGATSVHPHVRTLTDDEILHLQYVGLAIRPYTVKTVPDLERFRRLEVDAVFVNDIDWAKAYSTP